MSNELDLIRAFRAEDATVDAESRGAARAALLEHIASTAPDKRVRRRGWRGRRVLPVRVRADVVAVFVSVIVVLAVAALILSAGGQRPARTPAHHRKASGPRVIRNYWPRIPPPLSEPHTAALARPGAIAGLGGSRSGIFTGGISVVNGVNYTPFLITAHGLPPNARGSVYAVWLLPSVQTFRGNVLIKPIRPRLLGVIRPGVGRDGRLAAEGRVTADVLNNSYLVRITLQPNGSVRTPGRTVLEGFY